MNTVVWIAVIIGAALYLYFKRKKVVNSQSQEIDEVFDNKKDRPPLDKTIGETNAICPYCEKELEKKPSRKKKCPHCNNYIYKRTRPYDNANILIREDQIEDIEEQWAIKNGQHDLYLQDKQQKQKIRDRLKNQYGNQPADEDVEFKFLNKKATEYELKGDWGWGRNMRLKMAKNLGSRESYKLAIRTYCHVCFLDINGPNNRSGTPSELLQEFPYFTPQNATLSPGVIKLMKNIIETLNYDSEEVKREFIEVTTPIHDGIPTPMPPEKAWPKLKEELFED